MSLSEWFDFALTVALAALGFGAFTLALWFAKTYAALRERNPRARRSRHD